MIRDAMPPRHCECSACVLPTVPRAREGEGKGTNSYRLASALVVELEGDLCRRPSSGGAIRIVYRYCFRRASSRVAAAVALSRDSRIPSLFLFPSIKGDLFYHFDKLGIKPQQVVWSGRPRENTNGCGEMALREETAGHANGYGRPSQLIGFKALSVHMEEIGPCLLAHRMFDPRSSYSSCARAPTHEPRAAGSGRTVVPLKP